MSLKPASEMAEPRVCPFGRSTLSFRVHILQQRGSIFYLLSWQIGSKGESPEYLCSDDSSVRTRASTKGTQFTAVIPLAGNDKLLQAKNLSNRLEKDFLVPGKGASSLLHRTSVTSVSKQLLHSSPHLQQKRVYSSKIYITVCL